MKMFLHPKPKIYFASTVEIRFWEKRWKQIPLISDRWSEKIFVTLIELDRLYLQVRNKKSLTRLLCFHRIIYNPNRRYYVEEIIYWIDNIFYNLNIYNNKILLLILRFSISSILTILTLVGCLKLVMLATTRDWDWTIYGRCWRGPWTFSGTWGCSSPVSPSRISTKWWSVKSLT